MRLDLSSIVGDGFGTGKFALNGESTPPSFPPAGSYNSTLFGETYPIAEGGTYFPNPATSASVPNQICDVDVLNDGSGGTYIDWSSATNITYKAAGTYFYTDVGSQAPYGVNQVEVPYTSGTYYDPQYVNPTYEHDGLGSWQNGTPAGPYYYSNGTTIYYGSDYQTEIPTGSGSFYNNGTYPEYIWDGLGGYSTQIAGSYYSYGNFAASVGYSTEVPAGSNTWFGNGTSYDYNWDGNGGYYGAGMSGSYYSYGTFIVNYSGIDYYWDGSGGYYS